MWDLCGLWGLAMFCVSLPLLWLNEWNSVQNYDALREVRATPPLPLPVPRANEMLDLRQLWLSSNRPPAHGPYRSAPPPVFPTDAWLAGASPWSRWRVWL